MKHGVIKLITYVYLSKSHFEKVANPFSGSNEQPNKLRAFSWMNPRDNGTSKKAEPVLTILPLIA